jgi:energy-converting hydrogenase Eha subunit G
MLEAAEAVHMLLLLQELEGMAEAVEVAMVVQVHLVQHQGYKLKQEQLILVAEVAEVVAISGVLLAKLRQAVQELLLLKSLEQELLPQEYGI